jgi:hypothetical protein
VSRIRAYQLIEAAELADVLTTVNIPIPKNERQARPLVRLRNEIGQEAFIEFWRTLLEREGGKLTSKIIETAVAVKTAVAVRTTGDRKTILDISEVKAIIDRLPRGFANLCALARCSNETLQSGMTTEVARILAEQGRAVYTAGRVMEVATGKAAKLSKKERLGELGKFVCARGGISIEKSPNVRGELRRVMKDAAGCVWHKRGLSAGHMAQLATEEGYRTPHGGEPIDEGNIALTLSEEVHGKWIPNVNDDHSSRDEEYDRRARAEESKGFEDPVVGKMRRQLELAREESQGSKGKP